MKEKHTTVINTFNNILPVDLRQEWQEMVTQWEQDKSKPNPYTYTEKGRFSYSAICSAILNPVQPVA